MAVKAMGETGKGDEVRRRLVEATMRLLAEGEPSTIQARRLAREIGTSTTAVYHYFGGMSQLLSAVIREGFRRLDARLRAVSISDDPITDITRLALAYRVAAFENPHLYDLMFGLSAPGGYRPAPGSGRGGSEHGDTADEYGADAAYQHLVDAAVRAMRAGRIDDNDPALVAAQLWSLLHGYVSLELAGHFDQVPDSIGDVLLPLGRNLLIGLGSAPEQAAESIALAVDSLP